MSAALTAPLPYFIYRKAMIGATVPTIGGLANSFKYGDEWGCEAIQIYVTLSRTWEVHELTDETVEAFKAAWQKSEVQQVVAHVPYLVNPASPDEEMQRRGVERLLIEFARCERLGVPLLVLHPGGYRTSTKEAGLEKIVRTLDFIYQAFDNPNTRILLETMAGQGTMLGSSFEELAQILAAVERPEYLGVCFDTAHVFAAGYDIRGYVGYEDVLKLFDGIVGIDKIGAFHLNDSKTKLGSHNDRHTGVGEGELGIQVFHAIVNDGRFAKLPQMLELHNDVGLTEDNVDLLKRLQTIKEPIADTMELWRNLV